MRRSLDDQESPPALPELAHGQGRNRGGALVVPLSSLMKQILYIRACMLH